MIHRTTLPRLSALLLTLVPLSAHAQMANPPPAEPAAPEIVPQEDAPPKMNLTVAPPAPPLQRTAYVHEGFYLRVNVGPGVLWSNVNDKNGAAGSTSGAGFSFAADALVGGSPAPGMALGVGALTNTTFGVDMKDSTGTSRSQSTQFHFLVGPFFDAFPNNRQGFHLGAEFGFAGALLDTPLVSNAFGGGAAGWLGYDMWVAPEWSAGFQLRGNGAYMVGSGADASAFGLNLLITVLSH